MKGDDVTQRKLTKIIKANQYKVKTGASCHFIPYSDNRGLKLYHTRADRDYARKHQRKAARHGVAPEVYKSFAYRIPRNKRCVLHECEVEHSRLSAQRAKRTIYGYVTERVKQRQVVSEAQFKRLCKKLSKLMGLDPDRDYHWDVYGCPRNVGYKNGKLVCVDFDAYTLD